MPTGVLRQLQPPLLDCDLDQVALGDALWVEGRRAEVVGVKPGQAQALLFDDPRGLAPGLAVEGLGPMKLRLHADLRGRVLDALGEPCDGGGACVEGVDWPVHRSPRPWATRPDLAGVLVTGTRAIDALMTLGRGQRLAWMSSAGCGGDLALAKLARECCADLVVWASIGSHGHQMQALLEQDLGEAGRARCVFVAGAADLSAAARLQAGYTALAIAEYFREQGQHVLLIMDSLRPWLQASRELARQRGLLYPPSPVDLGPLPAWLARCGPGPEGSITALLHLRLEEAEWSQDELALAVDACLEGRVVLSKRTARRHLYPAIDVLYSVSHHFTRLAAREHLSRAGRVRSWLALYEEHREDIEAGLLERGQDPSLEKAIARQEAIRHFLVQEVFRPSSWQETEAALQQLVSG